MCIVLGIKLLGILFIANLDNDYIIFLRNCHYSKGLSKLSEDLMKLLLK